MSVMIGTSVAWLMNGSVLPMRPRTKGVFSTSLVLLEKSTAGHFHVQYLILPATTDSSRVSLIPSF